METNPPWPPQPLKSLSAKEHGQQVVGYLTAKGKLTQEEPETSLENLRWKLAEHFLRQNTPPEHMDARLKLVGMSLAYFVEVGYDNKQVAKDSDGPKSLDYVA